MTNKTITAIKMMVRQQQLLELQVPKYLERYHQEMVNSAIEISADGLVARVTDKPLDNR